MAIARRHAGPRRLSLPHALLLQAYAGVGLGALAGCALLLADAFGLRHLAIASADIEAAAAVILGGIMTLVPLVVATAIGLLAETDSSPPP
jgi:hypothetical protein